MPLSSNPLDVVGGPFDGSLLSRVKSGPGASEIPGQEVRKRECGT
jgi:hypothetical protein